MGSFTELSSHIPAKERAPLLRYGLPLLSVALALGLTSLLPPLAQGTPAALFYAAVTLSTLYGGRGVGWGAVILSALVLNYWFFAPRGSLQLTATSALQVLVFLLVSSLIVLLIRRMQGVQQQLFTERETLRITLGSIGDGVITTDIHGKVTYLNKIAAMLTGWTPEAALQRPIQEVFPIVHESSRQPVENPVFEVIRTGKVVRLANHTVLLAHNGDEHPIHDSGAPICNDGGELIGAVLVFQDDSERRQTLRLLAKSEERFRQLADAMPQIVWVSNQEGLAEYLNQRWLDYTGMTLATSLAGGANDAIHPDDLPQAVQAWQEAQMRSEAYEYEMRLRQADGKYCWHLARAVPIRNLVGVITHWFGTSTDIHARKQIEDELRQGEERFRALFEQAATGMAQVGLDGRYWRVNERLCQLLGYSREELLARTPYELTHPDDLAVNLTNNQRLVAGDLATYSLGKRYVCKNGSLIWINLTVALVRDLASGAPHYFVAVLEDIDHRKQVEAELQTLNEHLEERVQARTAELERSNYELDRFAYVASHDLKSPLRGIATLAGWITEDAEAVLPAASKEHLGKLRGRVKRMEKLLDDLLTYSRAGRTRQPPVLVNLGNLIENVVEVLNPPPGFVITYPEALPTVTTERVPLEIILRNLLGNAIKHHHLPTGHVQITILEDEQMLEFIITDDGPGIDPQYHTRIFEMFQTLQPRDQVEGSGMGLAVVKKLVENYGGTIQIESAPGHGATFRFTWPRQ